MSSFATATATRLVTSIATIDPYLPLATGRPARADAAIRALWPGEPPVAWFEVDGKRTLGATRRHDAHAPTDPRGSVGAVGGSAETDADVVARAIRAGIDTGVPVVGVLRDLGARPDEDVGALHGWGRVAALLAEASGQVPVVLVVDGRCLGGLALLLGLADVVVMTERALVFVGEPAACRAVTGLALAAQELGGVGVHATHTGVAHLVAVDLPSALDVVGDLLALLPANASEPAPVARCADPPDRPCTSAAAVVPRDGRHGYDVRDVLRDVVDDGELWELRAGDARSIVTALGRIGGVPVGLVANQPMQLAGALDIESSQKAARFVRWCDGSNLALVTFVDTPGFRPGKDQEWRGMIRHGAQLAFAYAEATVPRVCVVLRKAYGGAYIVMDSKAMGSDCCVAWPTAEVAVMGAAGAVEVLHRRRLAALSACERAGVEASLRADYEATYLSPRLAAERGYLDAVIDPVCTRQVLAEALRALRSRREHHPRRRHANTPL